ncbi:MAG TPA: phosphoenolpyruvate--protein phosphotransferase [Myxococcales bacterium LLY-WYZ-16_1]|nr:phosphoenolpyruvate--protein phosphotransferase [Myxococcales bacterium LLY-WYZ-16_1]
MSVRVLHGIPICPGVAFGQVHPVDRRRVTVPRFRLPPEQRNAEKARFERAIRESEAQLEALRSRSEEELGFGPVSNLLRAHAMILRDGAFFDAAADRIEEEGQNAEWAVRSTIREVKRLFDHVDHPYFRERRSDVDVVGDRVLRNLLGIESDPLANLPPGAVIAAYDLTPADTLALGRSAVAAFVTEGGGRTSHTAILARALGVPCVLGLSGLLDAVQAEQAIIVDGGSGTVVIEPSDGEVSRYQGIAQRRAKEEASLLADRDLPAQTVDGHRVRLFGNIEVRQEVEVLRRVGAEGVGLYRTEFLHIDEVDLEDPDAHGAAYGSVLAQMEGRPVTVRTLDLGGDKRGAPSLAMDWEPEADHGASPLGLRGIRISLRELPGFRVQLQGILQASARGPIRILLPFVTDLVELREAKGALERARRDLAAKGADFDPDVAVGVMIETPASVFCLEHLQEECDFFSVGTNDLVSLVMSADRNDEATSHIHRPAHPAVLRVLRTIRERASVPVCICGELAADPFMTPVLVGLGYDELSMAAASIPVVKRLVRRLDAGACRELVDDIWNLRTADEVEARIAERLRVWVPDLFGGAQPAETP